MLRRFVDVSPLVALLVALAPRAQAASVYYVSPAGTGCDCTKASPCPLSVGATNAQAGDTVVLLDGTYQNQSLSPVNSGTSSAWITFQADAGAVPILDGGGGDIKATGVGSDTSVYVRYVGIVARNWASGFSNQWTGSTTDFTANGNWAYVNCIGDGNTRNGFAFNSAKGITIHQCISAHNGTSTTSSWSSGFQLYGVQGSASDNVVDQNVAFENMDAQKHTDGSGFIVDTMVTGVAFINNLAFLNGGSCIRLTKSAGINIINNTCYHNGRDTADTGPTNPGEIYFTDGPQTQGLTFLNNIGVASGSTQDPSSAWVFNGGMGSLTVASNNKTSASFVGADGTNPDFHLASGSPLADSGTSSNAPATDIGFDPKCIKKTKPTDIAVPSWTAYSIDYTYIKSLGGVAKCWQPGKRPAGSGIDIGAYESNATAAPGTGGSAPSGGAPAVASCTANGGQSGGGGAPATGGTSGGSTGGSAGATGGSTGQGGTGQSATGGASGTATGGASGTATGGASGTATGGASGTATGGTPGSGGSGTATGGSSGEGPNASPSSGCACATSGVPNGRPLFAVLLLGLVVARARSRRRP